MHIYITLYKDSKAPMTSAFIDYIRIGDEIISFESRDDTVSCYYEKI
ncbi:MAG: hypothetical protein METHSR3v1_100004 [Methanothrix sp.]|nr:MAG: hypothetical protein METHSR3v1_100004 [Methanothrix sp.]